MRHWTDWMLVPEATLRLALEEAGVETRGMDWAALAREMDRVVREAMGAESGRDVPPKTFAAP